ncbi:MAG: mechanosensitive ion channel family protein [Candidatus Cloacimonetes bacterium]|nr:mechanosensitive ion channel family protein [Candidatus Cloacimonadota bacterium]
MEEIFVKLLPFLRSQITQKVILSMIIGLIIWLTDKIINKIITNKVSDVKSRYQWKKSTSYILVIVGILLIGRIWTDGIQSIATFFGLLSAGIAIALKDIIASLAGWIFIISKRPFDVGHRIEIGEVKGDVIDLSIFQFSILEIGNWVSSDQSTGRIIHIPNNKIFIQELVNYDKGFSYIWNEIHVLITFESNWQKAKKILSKIAEQESLDVTKNVEKEIAQAAKKFMIYYRNLTPIVYTDVKESGVQLSIRYLCPARKRRGTTQKIWENILIEFSKHKDIDLAYPTQRFFNNMTEGKSF